MLLVSGLENYAVITDSPTRRDAAEENGNVFSTWTYRWRSDTDRGQDHTAAEDLLPEPHPNWTAIHSSTMWSQVWWPIHVYGFSAAFLFGGLLSLMLSVDCRGLRRHLPRRPLPALVAVNLIIGLLLSGTAAVLLVDPYHSEGRLPVAVCQLVSGLAFPVVVATLTVLDRVFSALVRPRHEPGSIKHRRAISVVVSAFLLSVIVTRIVISLRPERRLWLLPTQAVSIAWGFSSAFLVVFQCLRLVRYGRITAQARRQIAAYARARHRLIERAVATVVAASATGAGNGEFNDGARNSPDMAARRRRCHLVGFDRLAAAEYRELIKQLARLRVEPTKTDEQKLLEQQRRQVELDELEAAALAMTKDDHSLDELVIDGCLHSTPEPRSAAALLRRRLREQTSTSATSSNDEREAEVGDVAIDVDTSLDNVNSKRQLSKESSQTVDRSLRIGSSTLNRSADSSSHKRRQRRRQARRQREMIVVKLRKSLDDDGDCVQLVDDVDNRETDSTSPSGMAAKRTQQQQQQHLSEVFVVGDWSGLRQTTDEVTENGTTVPTGNETTTKISLIERENRPSSLQSQPEIRTWLEEGDKRRQPKLVDKIRRSNCIHVAGFVGRQRSTSTMSSSGTRCHQQSQNLSPEVISFVGRRRFKAPFDKPLPSTTASTASLLQQQDSRTVTTSGLHAVSPKSYIIDAIMSCSRLGWHQSQLDSARSPEKVRAEGTRNDVTVHSPSIAAARKRCNNRLHRKWPLFCRHFKQYDIDVQNDTVVFHNSAFELHPENAFNSSFSCSTAEVFDSDIGHSNSDADTSSGSDYEADDSEIDSPLVVSTPSCSIDESNALPVSMQAAAFPGCLGLRRIRYGRRIRLVACVTYVTLTSAFCACALCVYSMLGVFGVLSNVRPAAPWSWLAFQTLSRTAEMVYFYSILAITWTLRRRQSYVVRHRTTRNSTN